VQKKRGELNVLTNQALVVDSAVDGRVLYSRQMGDTRVESDELLFSVIGSLGRQAILPRFICQFRLLDQQRLLLSLARILDRVQQRATARTRRQPMSSLLFDAVPPSAQHLRKVLQEWVSMWLASFPLGRRGVTTTKALHPQCREKSLHVGCTSHTVQPRLLRQISVRACHKRRNERAL
jgi:hypothetical protein